jgi:phage gpG-like protein
MTPEEFQQHLNSIASECKDYLSRQAPHDAAEIARQHFLKNFDNESFESNKWQEVKRRRPDSKWYGFKMGERKNFSTTRANDKILHDTGALRRSLVMEENTIYRPGEAHIVSDLPYSAVHNEGGTAHIFGKKAFTMPKRQFMGESESISEEIMDKINKKINKIISK